MKNYPVQYKTEGFKIDNANSIVKFYNTGHFALEIHCKEIG